MIAAVCCVASQNVRFVIAIGTLPHNSNANVSIMFLLMVTQAVIKVLLKELIERANEIWQRWPYLNDAASFPTLPLLLCYVKIILSGNLRPCLATNLVWGRRHVHVYDNRPLNVCGILVR